MLFEDYRQNQNQKRSQAQQEPDAESSDLEKRLQLIEYHLELLLRRYPGIRRVSTPFGPMYVEDRREQSDRDYQDRSRQHEERRPARPAPIKEAEPKRDNKGVTIPPSSTTI